MQVIRLERSDWQFFCPATGEAVFQESGEPNAKSVRGVWVDADTSDALFITPELEPAWEQHKKEREAIAASAGLPVRRLRLLLTLVTAFTVVSAMTAVGVVLVIGLMAAPALLALRGPGVCARRSGEPPLRAQPSAVLASGWRFSPA